MCQHFQLAQLDILFAPASLFHYLKRLFRDKSIQKRYYFPLELTFDSYSSQSGDNSPHLKNACQ